MSTSQISEKHKWENRVLIIISKESKTDQLPELFLQQFNSVRDSMDGCIDRKLLIYEVFPKRYKSSNLKKQESSGWIDDTSIFKFYNQEGKDFKIILIGLDGTIKETRNEPISSQELFSIIDGMFMRKAELRGKK